MPSQFLTFTHSGRRMAVSVTNVAHVCIAESPVPPPRAKPWMAGFTEHDGHVYPLIDLGEDHEPGAPATCVLVESPEHGLRFGLTVDEVLSLLEIESTAASPEAASSLPLVPGRDAEGGEWQVLHLDSVQSMLASRSKR